MQDKNVIKLTDQDAALLEQGASMLEGLENDERNRGNCSTAEGAGCSAHAVRRLASALLAHEREIGQCLHQIQEPAAAEQAAWHAGLDEGRAQAAPAAVAVPDERAAFETTNITGRYYRSPEPGRADEYADSHTQLAWKSWQARAALAATPAAAQFVDQISANLIDKARSPETVIDKAAAPVVLPEPDFWVRPGATIHPDRGWQCWSNDGTATGAFHAATVRALLATATGLPAQAVEMPDFDLRTSKGGRGFVAWYFANVLQRYDYENYITNKLAADFACDLAKALSSTLAAPQAQADARDAAPAAEVPPSERVPAVTVGQAGLDWLIADIHKLPTILASEIDGEESDGTPRHWRNRPFVSRTQTERLLREFLTPPPSEAT